MYDIFRFQFKCARSAYDKEEFCQALVEYAHQLLADKYNSEFIAVPQYEWFIGVGDRD